MAKKGEMNECAFHGFLRSIVAHHVAQNVQFGNSLPSLITELVGSSSHILSRDDNILSNFLFLLWFESLERANIKFDGFSDFPPMISSEESSKHKFAASNHSSIRLRAKQISNIQSNYKEKVT